MADEIEGILKVLESDKANADDRAKAYRNLYTLLKDENEKEAVYFLCSFLSRFLKRLINDIQNASDKVVHAGLHLLGYVMHHAQVVTYVSEPLLAELLLLLVRCIKDASVKSKAKCQLAVWCVAVQALNWSKVDLTPLIQALVCVFQSPFKSQGLEGEGVNALGRLLIQSPSAMMNNVVTWAPPLLRRMLPMVDLGSTPASTSSISSVSSSLPLREKAELVWRQALPLLSPVPDELSSVIFTELTSSPSMLTALLNLLEDQDKDVLHSVRVWGYFIRVLGKYLLRGDLINSLLKIPNKTFLHASTSIRTATFHNWRCLIDNFSEDMSSLNSRRLKLLMMPFYNGILKEEDVSVRQAGFQTWVYLVSKLARAHILEDNEVFEQVVTSYLIHVIRDSEPEIFNLGFEAAGLLIAPESDEDDNERALVQHSTLDSLGSLHLEISEEFFSDQKERRLEFFMDLVKEGAMKSEGW